MCLKSAFKMAVIIIIFILSQGVTLIISLLKCWVLLLLLLSHYRSKFGCLLLYYLVSCFMYYNSELVFYIPRELTLLRYSS